MYNETTTWIPIVELFYLLTLCFLLISSDLAVLIFPTLLIDFLRPNWKSSQSPWEGDIHLFNPLPLYCFILMFCLTEIWYLMYYQQSELLLAKPNFIFRLYCPKIGPFILLWDVTRLLFIFILRRAIMFIKSAAITR